MEDKEKWPEEEKKRRREGGAEKQRSRDA